MYEANVAYANVDTEISDHIKPVRRLKNKVAIQLLQSWLEDESGYDEEVWPKAKNAIEENRLSIRKKFNDKASNSIPFCRCKILERNFNRISIIKHQNKFSIT